jgi:DNA polymerase III delta prime subunit
MDLNNLIIPNINLFENFYYKHINEKNYNICITGPHYSCKSTICKLFINKFIQQNLNIKDKTKIVFELNYYDEVNLQNEINEITIFCNNNTNTDKLIYINNFDYFSDNNQQLFKIYLDKLNRFKTNNKVYFLIECNNIYKLKDFIKSRIDIFKTIPLTSVEKYKIFKLLLNKYNIKIEKNALEHITNISNININCWTNFLKKIKIVDISFIDIHIFNEQFYLLNPSIFDIFFKHIQNKELNKSIQILYDLYNDGYDTSDILFYIYNYIKDNQLKKYYCIIKTICKYINEIYNGFQDKLLFVFLVYDIKTDLNI